MFQFLTGKEIKYDGDLPKKLFRAFSPTTFSSQELFIRETCIKGVRGCQQAGESPFSNQLETRKYQKCPFFAIQ